MEYKGPKLKIKDKPFSKDLKPKGGFLKATYFKNIDGDTAVFKIDGKRETVRLLVINTPELSPVEKPYAKEAKEYFTNILENAKEIYLQSDKNSSLRDTTEARRLLAWVWVDNQLVNYNLVRMGFANVEYVASEKLKYLKKLRKAEKLAKKEKLRIHSVEENHVFNS